MVDTPVVTVAPGLGDDVQADKAGVLEIADVLVVNRADADGAARTANQLRQALHLGAVPADDDWPVPEVVAGHRSRSEAESSFRQMKDPHAVSFSPMHHLTEHNIRVHVFTCVLALQLAHLMRRRAALAGLQMSVRDLLGELAGIGETVLLYHGDRGRPRAHRMLTETSPVQDKLAGIFGLARYAPRR